MKLRNAYAPMLCATALSLSIAASPAAATVVVNTAPITVVDGGETISTINVAGVSGKITGLTLSLSGLSHTYPNDLVFGVVNQTAGLGFVFFSGVGGSQDISNLDLTFSDAAKAALPVFGAGTFASGTFAPANYSGYYFENIRNAASFSGFNGLSANGAWTLYVDDVLQIDGGSISRGWSLNFTTDAVTTAVPEPATWAMMLAGFGMIGCAARKRSLVKTTATYA